VILNKENIIGVKIPSTLLFLWRTLRPRRQRQFAWLLALAAITAIAEVMSLATLKEFISLMSTTESTAHPKISSLMLIPSAADDVIAVGLVFILFLVSSSVLRIICLRHQLLLCNKISSELAVNVFSGILQMPDIWHAEENLSTLNSRVSKNIDQAHEAIISTLSLFINILYSVFIVSALIAISPYLMAIMIPLLIILYTIVYISTRSSLGTNGKIYTSNYNKLLKIATESFNNIEQLQIHGNHYAAVSRFNNVSLSHRLASARININAQIPRYIIECVVVSLLAGIALYLSSQKESFSGQLSSFAVLILGVYRVIQPIQQIFSSYSIIKAQSHALNVLADLIKYFARQRTDRLLLLCPETHMRIQALIENHTPSSISISDLCFRYPSSKNDIIANFNLDVREGEKILVTGPSGSGKSTLIKLILGTRYPSKGTVKIGDVTAADIYQFCLHKNFNQNKDLLMQTNLIAYVPQKTILIDGNILENIALGLPSDTIDSVLIDEVCKTARLTEVIESMPNKYYSNIGDDGKLISGGQKQRIGLARALYRRPKILLIDEATSALDADTEKLILQSVVETYPDLTIIAISHSQSGYSMFDRFVSINT